jgi:hypothetical protein
VHSPAYDSEFSQFTRFLDNTYDSHIAIRWLCTPDESVSGLSICLLVTKMNRRKHPMLTRCLKTKLGFQDSVSRVHSLSDLTRLTNTTFNLTVFNVQFWGELPHLIPNLYERYSEAYMYGSANSYWLLKGDQVSSGMACGSCWSPSKLRALEGGYLCSLGHPGIVNKFISAQSE